MTEVLTRTIEAGAKYRPCEIYTAPERQGLVKLSKTRVYELIGSGKLPTVKVGRATFVRGADLLRLFGEPA